MNFEHFIERAKNFHMDFEHFKRGINLNQTYFEALYELSKEIQFEFDSVAEIDRGEFIRLAFTKIYEFTVKSSFEYTKYFDKSSFLKLASRIPDISTCKEDVSASTSANDVPEPECKNKGYYESVFDACFFTSLCIFIQETTRQDSMSIRNFLYIHSPVNYKEKGSPNYFDDKDKYSKKKASEPAKLLASDVEKFRKARNRLFQTKSVYAKRSEWSAVSQNSELEMAFIYNLRDNATGDQEKRLAATLKLIGNLNNGIDEALKAPKDENYKKNLAEEYEKYLSKLKKLKYENFIELGKYFLSQICEDEKHYGINIYRFEKSLSFFKTISEVNYLLSNNIVYEEDQSEENALLSDAIKFKENQVLSISALLKDVPYTELYGYLCELMELSKDIELIGTFNFLIGLVVSSVRLVFDEMVEKEYFGENWYDLFLDIINGMTEKVFYNPEEIEIIITPNAQDNFMKIISTPALYAVVSQIV